MFLEITKIPITSLLMLTYVLLSTNLLSESNGMEIREVIRRAREPMASCTFTVHETGPQGPEIRAGATLEQQLFYKIRCEPQKGYCLWVFNCTVRAEHETEQHVGGSPYVIIDARGCTTEPLLFEHVQYEDDFTAGIFNPYPIRFRSRSTGVRFQCATSLMLLERDGQCPRESCGLKGKSPVEKKVSQEKNGQK